jgi:methionyl-tRNA formyltransferase
MNKSKRLVFFGNERLATGLSAIEPKALPALIEAGYDFAAVVSHYHQARSRNKRDLEVGEVAAAHNIPLLLPDNLKAVARQLENYGAEAAVLVAYGKIIPQEIIDIFPKGIINIHPSLLPKYRGPTPIEQAILDGAKETGVSIMSLASKMDAGPVFAHAKIELSGTESKEELARNLLEAGTKLLLENLPGILGGSLRPSAQEDSEATYTNLLAKEEGQTNWSEAAEVLERKVRAYAGFPKSRAQLFGHDVVVTKVRVAKTQEDGELVMQCQPGWLEIQELTAPSGRTVTGAEFIRGYKKN